MTVVEVMIALGAGFAGGYFGYRLLAALGEWTRPE